MFEPSGPPPLLASFQDKMPPELLATLATVASVEIPHTPTSSSVQVRSKFNKHTCAMFYHFRCYHLVNTLNHKQICNLII